MNSGILVTPGVRGPGRPIHFVSGHHKFKRLVMGACHKSILQGPNHPSPHLLSSARALSTIERPTQLMRIYIYGIMARMRTVIAMNS